MSYLSLSLSFCSSVFYTWQAILTPNFTVSTPLVRAATGLSASESTYLSARSPIATAALAKWLSKTNSAFPTTNLPTVALTTSGGGLRSLLTGAGVIQAFDARDSNVGTSGIFQGLTYRK